MSQTASGTFEEVLLQTSASCSHRLNHLKISLSGEAFHDVKDYYKKD